MAPQVRLLASKPDDLSLILGTHGQSKELVEGLTSTHVPLPP